MNPENQRIDFLRPVFLCLLRQIYIRMNPHFLLPGIFPKYAIVPCYRNRYQGVYSNCQFLQAWDGRSSTLLVLQWRDGYIFFYIIAAKHL